jgi:leucyl/phenylalanyl-tRNA--protein transferase
MNQQTSSSRAIDPQILLKAYTSGFFPMAEPESGEIGWYSPDPRTIFELDKFKIPRSLKQTIKKEVFDVRIDERFEEVIRGCAARNETWISEDIIASYRELFQLGYCHSVECIRSGGLVGGLYGVSLGGAFFGESMFSLARDASKVALAFLVHHLNERGYELLDTQYMTSHLARFGAREIPRTEYLQRLEKAISKPCRFADHNSELPRY